MERRGELHRTRLIWWDHGTFRRTLTTSEQPRQSHVPQHFRGCATAGINGLAEQPWKLKKAALPKTTHFGVVYARLIKPIAQGVERFLNLTGWPWKRWAVEAGFDWIFNALGFFRIYENQTSPRNLTGFVMKPTFHILLWLFTFIARH